MKKFFNFIFSRIFFIMLMFLIQLFLFFIFLVYFNKYFIYLYGINLVIGLAFTFVIINDNINPAFKITWILISISIPILGGFIYLVFGEKRMLKFIRKKFNSVSMNFKDSIDFTKDYDLDDLNISDMNIYRQAKYINEVTGSPIFFNTKTEFFNSGENSFESYINDLNLAKKYIFMEYFIISEGFFFDSVLKILKDKVKDGVDVRITVDDIGSIFTLPEKRIIEMESYGIKIVKFNEVKGIVLPKHNNRNHRKMTIIDGEVAYTGGINIADEYINVIERFGYWKDSVIRIEGPAVASFVNMFICIWDYYYETKTDTTFLYGNKDLEYFSEIDENRGLVIPFSETPLNDSSGENIYLNMIKRANRYIYITTPYLVITWEMENALITAAKMGIDVRIITPHIPDKKYVHMVTRSFYKRLIDNGVKIYEFEKGFIHSKNLICDDEFAVVGSINLDYRSLYLHFECAVWMYGVPILDDIKEDFNNILLQSIVIDDKWVENRGKLYRIIQFMLKLFSTLM